MKQTHRTLTMAGVCAVLMLSGCMAMPLSFSPQQAAIRAAVESKGSENASVETNSIQVLQALPFGNKTFVVLSYSRAGATHHDQCLSTYATERSRIGAWMMTSGGGGCSGFTTGEPLPKPPLDITSGS